MYHWAQRICRWVVAGVLVAAAIGKWAELDAFVQTIGDFGLVWPGWERPTALLVPLLEALAGLMLFARRQIGYRLAATLLIAFTLVVAYGIWLGLDIECGCLGPADRWAGVTLETSLARNLVLLLALMFTWREGRGGD